MNTRSCKSSAGNHFPTSKPKAAIQSDFSLFYVYFQCTLSFMPNLYTCVHPSLCPVTGGAAVDEAPA